MDYLRLYAEEYGLREIVDAVAGNPVVQGAVLTIDDLWLSAWKLNERGPLEFERWLWAIRHLHPSPFGLVSGSRLETWDVDTPWFPLRPPDLHWRPPDWDMICDYSGRAEKAPPLRLIVCLRPPGAKSVEIPELPPVALPVSFEVRPIARLSGGHRAAIRPLLGGISVGTGHGTYGTLGGIVEDEDNVRYGMTCKHVLPSVSSVEQPALDDDPKASVVGKSSALIDLQACTETGPCNPYIDSPHITDVDTALVELDPKVDSKLEIISVGPLAGVVSKNSMAQDQQLTFVGRTSGSRVAQVGGLGVFYRLEVNGQAFCFRDLFEVRWRSYFRSLVSPVVQGGDSGAWVCAETDRGPGWCGQIIGEDRHVGYAAYAENIVRAWEAAGKQLRVAQTV